MKTIPLIVLFILLHVIPLTAGNVITAIIQYEPTATTSYAYTITVTCYTDMSMEADDIPLIFFPGVFGTDTLPVIEQTETEGIIKTVYTLHAAYPAPGVYTVFFSGDNMINGIINISGSVNIPVFTETDLIIWDPVLYNGNTSPRIFNDPIITTQTGESLNFNLAVYDVDGDQLSYAFYAPDLPFSGIPDGIILDHLTGEISWDMVTENGIFMLPVLITEIREGDTISETQVNIMLYSGTYPGTATSITTQNQTAFNIFPSPADAMLTVQFPAQTDMLQLINLSGMVLKTIPVAKTETSAIISLDDLPSGIYMMQFNGAYTGKMLKFMKN